MYAFSFENVASQVAEPLFSRLIFLFSYSHLGWFARDPKILSAVGHVLLQSPHITPIRPTQIIIAEDCFQLSSVPFDVVTQIVIKAIQKLHGGKCLIICFSININSVLSYVIYKTKFECFISIMMFDMYLERFYLPIIFVAVYTTADSVLRHEILGEYVKAKVLSLKHFMSEEKTDQVYNIPSLAALSSAMRLLQRYSSLLHP